MWKWCTRVPGLKKNAMCSSPTARRIITQSTKKRSEAQWVRWGWRSSQGASCAGLCSPWYRIRYESNGSHWAVPSRRLTRCSFFHLLLWEDTIKQARVELDGWWKHLGARSWWLDRVEVHLFIHRSPRLEPWNCAKQGGIEHGRLYSCHILPMQDSSRGLGNKESTNQE